MSGVGAVLSVLVTAVCGVAVVIVLLGLLEAPTEYIVEVAAQGKVSAVAGLAVNATFVDWGTLMPGGNVSRVVEVSNVGSKPLLLRLQVNGFVPVNASDFLVVSWSYSDELLLVGESMPVALTLTVDPLIMGVYDFGFNMVIMGD